jgi:hypothetical protein
LSRRGRKRRGTAERRGKKKRNEEMGNAIFQSPNWFLFFFSTGKKGQEEGDTPLVSAGTIIFREFSQ